MATGSTWKFSAESAGMALPSGFTRVWMPPLVSICAPTRSMKRFRPPVFRYR